MILGSSKDLLCSGTYIFPMPDFSSIVCSQAFGIILFCGLYFQSVYTCTVENIQNEIPYLHKFPYICIPILSCAMKYKLIFHKQYVQLPVTEFILNGTVSQNIRWVLLFIYHSKALSNGYGGLVLNLNFIELLKGHMK